MKVAMVSVLILTAIINIRTAVVLHSINQKLKRELELNK